MAGICSLAISSQVLNKEYEMNLTYKKVKYSEDKELFLRIENLANSVFPPHEIVAPTMFRDYENDYVLLAFFDNDFVGFAALVPFENIVYLAFFVVDISKQNQGYGSAILSLLKEIYKDKIIILESESITGEAFKNATNKKERLKRAKFYEKNAFKNYKITNTYFGESYDIYANSDDEKVIFYYKKLYEFFKSKIDFKYTIKDENEATI